MQCITPIYSGKICNDTCDNNKKFIIETDLVGTAFPQFNLQNLSIDVMKCAIYNDPTNIRYLINPPEEIQLLALILYKPAFKYISNPHPIIRLLNLILEWDTE